MQKILLLLVSLLILLTKVQAQQAYTPMLKPNHTWIVNYAFFMDNATYTMKMGKDSMINGKKYYLIHGDFISEDSSAAKVYIYKKGKETVLYDFNLKVGATIDYSAVSSFQCKYTVKSITNISFPDGSLHKKYELQPRGIWISGIGSLSGPTFPPNFGCLSDPSYGLACFLKGSQLMYGSNDYGLCKTLGNNEVGFGDDLIISPNPITNGLLNISSTSDITNCKINIYNTVGNLFLSKEISENQTTIDLSLLPKGMYFLQFQDTKKRTTVKKLMVETD